MQVGDRVRYPKCMHCPELAEVVEVAHGQVRIQWADGRRSWVDPQNLIVVRT